MVQDICQLGQWTLWVCCACEPINGIELCLVRKISVGSVAREGLLNMKC